MRIPHSFLNENVDIWHNWIAYGKWMTIGYLDYWFELGAKGQGHTY